MTESKRPLALTIVFVLVWFEAAASLIYGVLQAVNLIFQGAQDVGGAVSVIVFALMVAAWLFFSAVKLLRGARWARNAVIFWQAMQIAVGSASFDSLSGKVPTNVPFGIAVIAPAALVIVLLFTKKVMKLTVEDSSSPASED